MKNTAPIILLLAVTFINYSCKSFFKNNNLKHTEPLTYITNPNDVDFDTSIKTIHIFVALCDNKYQGIQPVPKAIGNGQNPASNLYWGCSLGIKSYFKNSKSWTLVQTTKKDSIILERIIFKHKTTNTYLIADAFDGQYIETCTKEFLSSCAGSIKTTATINNIKIGSNGNAQLLGYIGHDGLMDFELENTFKQHDSLTRQAIILACISKNYFAPYLKSTGAQPLVWTTGLMAPEAYTIHDAIEGYLQKKSNAEIRMLAANAYSKYQRCSIKAASNLLVTGW